jgi:23S rRNA (adenine2503-C2)-methyltransferase
MTPEQSSFPILFKEHSAIELHQRLAHLGVTERLARRLQAVVVRDDAESVPTSMNEVPRRLLEQVAEATVIPRLTLLDKVTSPRDGFTKYLFKGDGEQPFETVRIPLLHRPEDRKYVVCVSSQVGCALACAFCATGRMGFQRNLAAWEIVDQVLRVKADSEYPIRGVVFMGMGEPFLNYDRVMQAAAVLCEPCGPAIDSKGITISTAGVAPMIRRFTAEGQPYRLIVSLTSADPEKRGSLMPIEKTHPLPELMAAIRAYHAVTGKRVTLAWATMAGVNTSVEDARQIAALTAGMPVRVDLIDVNDPSGEFLPPSEDEMNGFRDSLTVELGMPVARRYSGGGDINGGCGMLAGKVAHD